MKRVALTVAVLILLIPSALLAQEQTATLNKPVVTIQTSTTIDLAWPAVSGATSYEVWAWDGEWTMLADDTPTQFSHTDFVPGTDYFYTVRSTNDRGEVSDWSDYVSATGPAVATSTPTPTATPIPVPVSTTTSVLTAQPAAVAVELSWTEVAGAARYELLTWWDAAIGWQNIGGNSLAGTTYTHTGLTAGVMYYYAIRGLDAAGDAMGAWSEFASAIPMSVTAATQTPTPTPTTQAALLTDRDVLVALYHATDGPNWKRSDHWLTDTPLDDWYGVDADRSGRVIHLDLSDNQLHGPLPDLSLFSRLVYLVLSDNQLHGPLPDLRDLPYSAQVEIENTRLCLPAGYDVSNAGFVNRIVRQAVLPHCTETQKFPPFPAVLESNIALKRLNEIYNFQKYLKAGGVHVLAQNEVPDLIVEQTGQILIGMLSDRPDLLDAMAGYETVILIFINYEGGGSAGWAQAKVDDEDPFCNIIIHEIAHLIHYTIDGERPRNNQPPSGKPFDTRLRALYQAAMSAGLWNGLYASTRHSEYWAVSAHLWVQERMPLSGYSTLKEYDPNMVAFIEETLGDASVPWYCK